MHIDPIRLIRWVSGASLPDDLSISDTDPDPGIMGPDSFTWHMHHEQWLILGGARAFLMQAAHPKVAQGALDHSAYAEDPFGRVYRTVMAMSVFLAGTTHEVNTMARQINRLHATVTGTINQASAGRHPAGEPYTGMDPDGLLWVQVSFVDSMLSAYQHFIGPLSAAQREQYWQESLRYARRLGLTDATLPASYTAMQAYLREAIASGEVAVSPGARTVAHTVLYPPLPWYRQRLWGVVRLITSGQLPPELRKGYGLRWTWADWLAFKLVSNTLRLTRWLFPNALGRSVLVGFAERRVRGELALTQPKTPSSVAD
ncbi:MAG TPA: oxygenase MpaB family protein [Ktedonobacterales bacterium]|nr:oxygenase MpaB family protein [Ktedonobacterales bacterium]